MLELDKTTFEAEVLQAPGKILVDFYGDGCVPCAALILGLPVIAIYENGEMIDSCVKDDATPENVEAMIKKYI